MQGKILKGIAGFYYVYGEDEILYECKAKGSFRKEKVKPLVGDNVEIDVLDRNTSTGNIQRILPRKNELVRPSVANIDQALILFALKHPTPNFNLLDRFLIMMHQQNLPCIICFNKQDIASEKEQDDIQKSYEKAGYQVFFLSVIEDRGIENLQKILQGRTTTVAGPSGVGKSSLINRICPIAQMEVGEISRKIKRGKNTTRHTELFAMNAHSYIMDTPGFSSLNLFEIEKEELRNYYPEFKPYEDACRFSGCVHIKEPGCAVKAAIEQQQISELRYRNYQLLYTELKEKRKY